MIRRARIDDLCQLQEIYNDAILHTVATFDMEIKDLKERKQWFYEHEKEPYVILVEEDEKREQLCGYASLSCYRERKAFARSVEISIYVHKDYRQKGCGSRLMEAVLSYAKKHPQIHVVVSLITSENAASIHLHEKFGFVYCGQLKQVGYKLGRWLNLNIYQLSYGEVQHD